MKCAWTELLAILPQHMKQDVDELGRDRLQELRLRYGKPPQLILRGGERWLTKPVSRAELTEIIQAASQYSPWTAASITQGYITAPGGHRIGLCGEVALDNGKIKCIQDLTSLCIRVARDIPMIGEKIPLVGNLLIIGPPGSGKTTMLRALSRRIAQSEIICVVDERGELFPDGFATGKRMDVLRSCPKASGIEMVLRTMNPGTIAVDEITASEDTKALLSAAWCGVRLMATAHASGVLDLKRRKIYQPLLEHDLFDTLLVMHGDKSWHMERIGA